MSLKKEIPLTLLLVWPLLVGMFFIMVGNGLQGTLLSLRASLEGFPISIIGIVMSMYYCGYLGGWYIVPKMINSVGHIRVFAGFASLASTTILLQGMFVEPFTWGAVRVLSGISFVGLFIVSESWLNDIAPNHLRARIFSAYIFVVHCGLFMGQFLINLAPISDIALFVLISIIVSLSLIPVTLANKATPSFEDPEHLPFKKLLKTSPHAILCVLTAGFTNSAMLSMAPVLASSLGMPVSKVALIIAFFVLGCGTIPLLTGWLSDIFGRRIILNSLALCGTIVTAIAVFFVDQVMILSFFLGGCATSSYTVASSMMNDRLKASQRTSATASLILINGISSCISPILIGALMQIFGVNAFFSTLLCGFSALFIYGFYRSFTGTHIDVEDQGEYLNLPARAGPSLANLLKVKKRKST